MSVSIKKRRARILEIISNNGEDKISDFSKQLDTSGISIRRDLVELEKAGISADGRIR